ncbi:MAG: hypothetical protein LBG81_00445, partial [Coriobacteriaceae bacterium]|nr:hypothetical protein [Coriobacteriaceae bacterium]
MPDKNKTRAESRESLSHNKSSYALDGSGVRGSRSSRNGVYLFASLVFVITFVVIVGACYLLDAMSVWAIIAAAAAGSVMASSVRIAQQWEKAVVLRLGKYTRTAGPGLYFIVPVIEHVTLCIDQRIIATPFMAEETLTADLVSVDVDAVLFWMVWDARKACVEVENYPKAVAWS